MRGRWIDKPWACRILCATAAGPVFVMKNPIATLRKIALVEGLSYLVLLGIAMPLKYLMDQPLAVKVVGWLHGVLFVWLCALILIAMIKAGLSLGRATAVFIASLLPFGPYLLDKRMVGWEKEFERERTPEQAMAGKPA